MADAVGCTGRPLISEHGRAARAVSVQSGTVSDALDVPSQIPAAPPCAGSLWGDVAAVWMEGKGFQQSGTHGTTGPSLWKSGELL